MGLARLALGQVLSTRYTLERELGRGGMATVYLARDLQASRLVALKVLRPEVAAALGTERFLREIRLTAQLQHPHILGLLDSGEADGCLYYTMPYVAGDSLRARLVRQPQLPIDEALRIATEVAQALAYAHAQGVVHRDIKPENIVLESTEAGARALVTDFGIAQALSLAGGERLTATGFAIGTPAYMSPEQARGSRVDRRSDLYSLGCVLYEMLGGEPPYTGPTGPAVLSKQAKAPIPHLRALRPEVPPAVEQAVTRALAKSPADRFATAEQFAAALAPGQPPATVHLPRWRVRRTTALVFGTLLVGTVIAAGAVLRLHRSPTAPPSVSVETRRVVVAIFDNRTGDPSLDPLGDIAADYLARGLAETRLVEVIDVRAEQSGDSSGHAGGIVGARALARALGAGSVISGTYSRQGDSLRFEAQLTDAATGKPLAAISPAVGSAGQRTQGVEALRQHVMAALAERFDPRLASFADVSASHAVSYEAYREFLAGDTIPVFGGCDPCVPIAIAHYRRAYAFDTNFTLPLVEIAKISAFAGPCERTDSIADVLRPRHDRLPPLDRLQLDWVVAKCHGQPEKVLEIVREAMAVAPRSDFLVYVYARTARLVGRLHESIAMTERLDPKRHARDFFYWGNRAIAYHLLGEHQRELDLAHEGRRVVPGNMEALGWEAHALVGLGRLAEVNALVDEAARVPLEVPQVLSGLLTLLRDVGQDLRAHGYREPARAVFERGIRWIKARPAAEQQRDPELRYALATLLYDRERWDEARQILKQLAAETPSEMAYQGMIGAVAARQGDRREVARIDRWLAHRTGPYVNGEHTFNRARLAAILGDRVRAVELYRLALDQGYALAQGGYFGHADPDFESLRDYPPFQELTRSKD